MAMWLIVLGSAIWVLIDAKKIGVRKDVITGIGNIGPWAWFFCCLLLWIVAFPLYLFKRGDFKKALQGDQPVAASSNQYQKSSLADLEKLAELKEKGIISDAEFQAKKQEILGQSA